MTQNDEQRFSSTYHDLIIMADNSIRELIAFDDISNYASATQHSFSSRWMEENLPLMDGPSREKFAKAAHDMAEAVKAASDHIKESAGGEFESRTVQVPGGETGAAFNAFITVVSLDLSNHAKVTARAFLIAAESSFEVLFGQVARVVYGKHPEALPKSDHSFTLDELSSFESIEGARDFLVTRRIESLMRESADEWSKWLKRTVGLSMDQITSNWPQIREIFVRRNVLVHTEGKVTERYISELTRAGGSAHGLEVGQSLIPTVEYLKAAMQQMIALEVLLTCKVISHIDKQNADEAASWLAWRLDWVVRKELWYAARIIADGFDGARCKRDTQLRVQANGWLAHKNCDGLDSIRDQVETWDVSGLSRKYQMLKSLLLDQMTESDLERMLDDGSLTRFEVLTDPIYADVRKWITSADSTPTTQEKPETGLR
jgi:hypothetical protein